MRMRNVRADNNNPEMTGGVIHRNGLVVAVT